MLTQLALPSRSVKRCWPAGHGGRGGSRSSVSFRSRSLSRSVSRSSRWASSAGAWAAGAGATGWVPEHPEVIIASRKALTINDLLILNLLVVWEYEFVAHASA